MNLPDQIPKPAGSAAAVVALALLTCLPLAALAQGALPSAGDATTPARQRLPNAPSSIQVPELQRTAGSGLTFTAPSSVPGPGGLGIEQPTGAPLSLTLDDAVSLALKRNVRLRYDAGTQGIVNGYRYQVANALLPNFTASGSSSAEEINLAAMGFKPQSVGALLGPGLTIPTIVKVNVTQARVSITQRLFDMSALELYRGSKREFEAVDLNVLNDRGQVVLATAQAYLKILSDQANLANSSAQQETASTAFFQAKARHDAGVATNLDALRAQVTLQQREQDRIAADSQLDKDGIQLNRIMGLPANQPIDLTDTAPFAVFNDMDLNRAKATAYRSRKDLLSLEANIEVTDREQRAVKYQRLPTVAFNGYYGVLGETTGLYHGVFQATGTVNFPIFREAAQRGELEQVNAQLTALRQREADLRVNIDAQLRAAMLDVESSRKLVEVAQSNVALTQQALADARDRFASGVDDNLPVVDAQASVVGAQAQLVQSLYQYNVSKLMLASATGVTESRYRSYLGK